MVKKIIIQVNHTHLSDTGLNMLEKKYETNHTGKIHPFEKTRKSQMGHPCSYEPYG